MKNDEKNDLMQNITQESNSSMRKYLIIGGIVFIIFVVGITIAKFVFSPSQKNNTKVIVPPPVETQQSQPAKETKNNNNLFNTIPVETEQNMKAKPESEQSNINTKNTINKINNNNSVNKIKEQNISKSKTTPPKVEVKKVVSKPVVQPKQIKKITKTKTNIKLHYYIQVAAVTRDNPSKKFLALIRKNGFNYKIVKVKIKGMSVQRILVGGYKTRLDALQALPKVRAKISSSAFIKRLK